MGEITTSKDNLYERAFGQEKNVYEVLDDLDPDSAYWIIDNMEDSVSTMKCSKCNIELPYLKDFKYCPNCGLKMTKIIFNNEDLIYRSDVLVCIKETLQKFYDTDSSKYESTQDILVSKIDKSLCENINDIIRVK